MFCAMPIALWEARKVRLDARIYGGWTEDPARRGVEGSPAPKGESHENRRRGRRYECLFFFSFFSFYYPGRTRQASSESVDGGGSARESRDVSAAREGAVSMTTTTTTGSNAASNEGIVERKGGRESKVAFSRLVDGARSVIASLGYHQPYQRW